MRPAARVCAAGQVQTVTWKRVTTLCLEATGQRAGSVQLSERLCSFSSSTHRASHGERAGKNDRGGLGDGCEIRSARTRHNTSCSKTDSSEWMNPSAHTRVLDRRTLAQYMGLFGTKRGNSPPGLLPSYGVSCNPKVALEKNSREKKEKVESRKTSVRKNTPFSAVRSQNALKTPRLSPLKC